MNKKLSKGSELIIIRNENEIRELVKKRQQIDKDIRELQKQIDEIKGGA